MGEEATAEGPAEEASRMICIYGHVTARLFPMAVETWRDFWATGVYIGQRQLPSDLNRTADEKVDVVA